MSEKQEKIALFRYGIITHVIHSTNQAQCMKEISTKTHDVPYLGQKKFKAATLKKWLLLYRNTKFIGI